MTTSEAADYYEMSHQSYPGLLNHTSVFLPLSVSDLNTVLSTGLNSPADDVGAVGPEIDNTTDGYNYDNFELYIASFDVVPSGGPVVELHIVEALDGDNYQDGDDPSEISHDFRESIQHPQLGIRAAARSGEDSDPAVQVSLCDCQQDRGHVCGVGEHVEAISVIRLGEFAQRLMANVRHRQSQLVEEGGVSLLCVFQ